MVKKTNQTAEPIPAQGPEINDADGKPIFHADEEAGDDNE